MKAAIDFGSSSTDFVVTCENRVIFSHSFENDKFDSKKCRRFIENYDLDELNVTGGRVRKNEELFKDLKITYVDEVVAIGLGGTFVSKCNDSLVVSIGSGTAMVSMKSGKAVHIGGTSVGARTLMGLGEMLLGISDIKTIARLSSKGNTTHVDITLSEIYPNGIGILPAQATASHFGKLGEHKKSDIAAGLFNMVAQTVGSISVFGAKASGHKKIVLTGKIASVDEFSKIITERINTLSTIPVMIPKNAGIATAIGAAIVK